MNHIVNTARDEAQPAWLTDAGPELVDCQRARGQHQLLHSNALPTWLRAVDERVLLEMGFELDPAYPDDPLFRPATLPHGWTLVPTPHVLWSQIVDAARDPWYQIFYDAAYFQRRAFLMPAVASISLRPRHPTWRG